MPPRTDSGRSRDLLIASLAVGALCCAICVALGRVSPPVVAILRDFEKPATWQESVLAAFHLVWTLPVAVSLFLALLWKDRHFPHSISRQINVASLIAAIAIFAIWFYAVLNRLFALTGHLLEVKPH